MECIKSINVDFFLVYTVVFVIIKLVFPRENYITYIKKRQIIVQTQIPHTKKSKLDHVILTFILYRKLLSKFFNSYS